MKNPIDRAIQLTTISAGVVSLIAYVVLRII
jgi:hypothetical protein